MSTRGVLLIGNFISQTSGSRGASEDLAQRLAQRGWQVVTATPHTGRVRRLADIIWTIQRRRDEYTVANIEVYSGAAFIWAEIAAWMLRRLHKPYALTLHGGGLPDFQKRWPNRVQRMLALAGCVLTPSRFVQQAFTRLRGDIVYLPNGLDLSHYPFRLRTQAQPRLAWLRAFHAIYQPEMAVEVLGRVKERYPQAHLTMFGPDKHDGSYDRVLQIAARRDLSSNLTVVGPIQKREVPTRLQQCDIYLNTPRLESFGIAVMEAAALGLPIVTTAVGELPLLWQDGSDALLTPPGDAEAMAAAVLRLLDEPGLVKCLSQNARRKAEGFDWPALLPVWEALFELLVASAERQR